MTEPRVVTGLARNPAAPAGVLLRLLGPATRWAWFTVPHRESLPEAVVAALMRHPEPAVRGAYAESPHAPARLRARLADDPSAVVRLRVAAGPLRSGRGAGAEPPPEPLPDEVHRRLLADPDERVRARAAESPAPPRLRAELAAHPEAALRRAACDEPAWELLPAAARAALLADPEPAVRRAAALRACAADPAYTAAALDGCESWQRDHILGLGRLDHALAERYATSPDAGERAAVAHNASLPPGLVERLAADPDPGVRLAISARPELSEEQRAAIDYLVGPGDMLHPLEWVWRANDDPAVLRRCAASAHPWLRRSAAASPHLPGDAVERLARDEDAAVRLLLCERHPRPPAELLLQTFLSWQGVSRWDLLRHPRFPVQGLARHAGHPEPERRALACRDPGAPAGLIERLSHDPDDAVRGAAAASPRLTAARLEELLSDPAAGPHAAANPALPVAAMHRLLDDCGADRP